MRAGHGDACGVRASAILSAAVGLLAPPRCGACVAPCAANASICCGCATELARAHPSRSEVAGIGEVVAAAGYSGVAAALIAGLKFQGRLDLAAVIGAAIAAGLGPAHEGPAWSVVAVPPAPRRRRARGFDPAELIAVAVAAELALPLVQPLRRTDGPRQVGRSRRERLASPPRVRAVAPAPSHTLLVDDVVTTGATLASCAAALRGAGAFEIHAAVFARALGEPSGQA